MNTPQLDLEGLLRGTGDVQASVINRGTVSPGGDAIGSSVGTMNQTGSYMQTTTGTLAIEAAGNGGVPGTDFDQFAVSGDAILDGTLDVDLINPFVPVFGDAFPVLTAASVSGVFTSVNDFSAKLGLSSASNQRV